MEAKQFDNYSFILKSLVYTVYENNSWYSVCHTHNTGMIQVIKDETPYLTEKEALTNAYLLAIGHWLARSNNSRMACRDVIISANNACADKQCGNVIGYSFDDFVIDADQLETHKMALSSCHYSESPLDTMDFSYAISSSLVRSQSLTLPDGVVITLIELQPYLINLVKKQLDDCLALQF